MGQKSLIGLVAIAVVVGLVLYLACIKPSVSPKPTGDVPSAHVTEPERTSAKMADQLPKPKDPAVAAAVDELLAAWEKLPSAYAAVETMIPEVAGNPGKTTGKGKYYLQKQDGKTRINFELRNTLFIDQQEGNKLVTGEILHWLIDGDYLYTFTNQPGFMQASKKKLDYGEVLQIGGPVLFLDLLTNNKLSLLPEEMVEGRAVRVVLATPNDGAWKTAHYFDKATGIRLKMEETDATGKTTLRITLTDFDLESSISDSKFIFTVPEGVKFVDETAQTPPDVKDGSRRIPPD
jgi:outer membrane lipoprotein-sorting protein